MCVNDIVQNIIELRILCSNLGVQILLISLCSNSSIRVLILSACHQFAKQSLYTDTDFKHNIKKDHQKRKNNNVSLFSLEKHTHKLTTSSATTKSGIMYSDFSFICRCIQVIMI